MQASNCVSIKLFNFFLIVHKDVKTLPESWSPMWALRSAAQGERLATVVFTKLNE